MVAKKTTASGRVHRINLLDPSSEPSDAALSFIMGAMQRSAQTKSENANRALFARLQQETKTALARLGDELPRFAPHS